MRLLLISIFLFQVSFSKAQGGFNSRITPLGSISNVAKGVFEVSPGSYIAGGIVYDTLSGNAHNHLSLMGLNSTGQVQWEKNYGTASFEYLENTFASRSFKKIDNAIFYTGCVRDINNTYLVGVLIKFNLNGDTLWQKIFRDSTQDVIPQIVGASEDGGFLMTGFFQDWVNHIQPCMIIKTDVNGNELWRKIINKQQKNVHDGRAVLQDSASKKIIIVGYQYIGNQNSWSTRDNILILDSLGNTIVQKNYNSGYLLDLIQTKDEKFIAVGNTETYNASDLSYYYNSYMVKFDINNPNQPIWKNNIYDQTSTINTFSCLKELPNGDILIAGSIDSLKVTDTLSNTNIRYIKINPNNGQVLWRKDYDYQINASSPFNDLAVNSLELTGDGGWVSAIRVGNAYSRPLLYVKYDSTGCDATTAWCKSVALGVSEINKITSWNFEIFPNPAKSIINFKIGILTNEKYKLRISDITGRQLEELNLDTPLTALNIANYEEGIYFADCIYKERVIEKRKFVVVK